MHKLTKIDVKHVAKLAKLYLSEDEIDNYLKQLSSVIDYISELSEVNTESVEPTSQTTGLENIFRSDEIIGDNRLSQEEALSGSENVYNGYFKVAAILSERTDK